ncbi:MAG: leucyl/phenylalanyl-tRNA--protein transferase [Cycloclasticus sp. symbiont of Poecilosclerida sp. M]|nr:MAG: leucyl/phenylalanyl-tRNA--protein transferase [Cycloclasticus sp. symbiont of Poecilosclerida sp. M]
MLCWLDSSDDKAPFPALEDALEEPNGLLAAGGSLRPERLMAAYRQGIFPWFDERQPILWWSPNPRMIVLPDKLHISKSLKKHIKNTSFNCTFDQAFAQVIEACAETREDGHGTWITDDMLQAYNNLHHLGHAHSIEVWDQDELVGGLYGVNIGQVFFGESMFSRHSNASKQGFAYLCQQLTHWGYQYIDCQIKSEHLESLGAHEVSRATFRQALDEYCPKTPLNSAWVKE